MNHEVFCPYCKHRMVHYWEVHLNPDPRFNHWHECLNCGATHNELRKKKKHTNRSNTVPKKNG